MAILFATLIFGLLPPEADPVPSAASENYPRPYKNSRGRFIYLDSEGRTAIDEEFVAAEPFAGGRAVVYWPDGRAGVIDASGRRLIEGSFTAIKIFGDWPRSLFFRADSETIKEKRNWSIFGTSKTRHVYTTQKFYDADGRQFYSRGPYPEAASYDTAVFADGRRIFVVSGSNVKVFEQEADGRIKKSRDLYSVAVVLDEDRWLKNNGANSFILCRVDTGECGGPAYHLEKGGSYRGNFQDSSLMRVLILSLPGDEQHKYAVRGYCRGMEKIPYEYLKLAPYLSREQAAALARVIPAHSKVSEIENYDNGAVVITTKKDGYYLAPEGPVTVLPPASSYYYVRNDYLAFSGRDACGILDLAGGGYHMPPTPECGLRPLRKSGRMVRSDYTSPSYTHEIVTSRGKAVSRKYKLIERTVDADIVKAVPLGNDAWPSEYLYLLVEDGRELLATDQK